MFKFLKTKNKKTKNPENLKEIFNYIKELEENIENLSEGLQNVKQMAINSIQRIGIVRYNPFGDVGSDQSFSIALLNEGNAGFVITNLYSREGSRVFAKPIKAGKSDYQLSSEEVEAIKKAIAGI